MVSKCRLALWLLTFVTLFFAIDIVHAQNRWNVEIRPAVNFPSKVDGGLHKHVGFGLEGKTIFSFSEKMGTYIGWGWNLFPANIKADFSYEETGLHAVSNTCVLLVTRILDILWQPGAYIIISKLKAVTITLMHMPKTGLDGRLNQA